MTIASDLYLFHPDGTPVRAGRGTALSVSNFPESPDYMSHGIIVSKADLDTQPMSGSAWTNLKAEADAQDHTAQADFLDNNGDYNTQTLAEAIVYARMKDHDAGADTYRNRVHTRLQNFVNFDTSTVGAEELGRNTGALAMAADMINLGSLDSALDSTFRTRIQEIITQYDSAGTDGMYSVVDGSLRRPNNHGIACRVTLMAVYMYLEDNAGIEANVIPPMRRWLGDTSYHNGSSVGTDAFNWHADSPSWMLNPGDPSTYVGVNPAGATKDGNDISALQPEDIRRGTPTTYDAANFPNDQSSVQYIWLAAVEALWIILMLERAGYSGARLWSDSAMRRSVENLYWLEANFPALGYDKITNGATDKCNVTPLCNYLYGTALTEYEPAASWDWWGSTAGFEFFLFQGRTF